MTFRTSCTLREVGRMSSDSETCRSLPSRTILLVEDNQADVRLLQEAFKLNGSSTQLQVARDGKAALDHLRECLVHREMPLPDLILLDLNLPCRGGQDVLQAIKSDPELRVIPVVVLTTSSAAADIDSAYAFRANSYIVKPMGLEPLLAQLRSLETFWFSISQLPHRVVAN